MTKEKLLSHVIRDRRSTPSFGPETVPEDDLRKILDAGLSAPSGFNTQPWRFVVVRDPEQRRKLRAAAMNQERIEEAPVVIVACGDSAGWRSGDLEEMLRLSAEHGFGTPSDYDSVRKKVAGALGSHPEMGIWLTRQVMIAATHMMLMAEALGYDTSPMEGFWEDQVKALLGIPDSARVVLMLCIGKLKGKDKRFAGRFAISRVVFGERWGEKLEL